MADRAVRRACDTHGKRGPIHRDRECRHHHILESAVLLLGACRVTPDERDWLLALADNMLAESRWQRDPRS
ncbi:hypothetical protein BBK82_35975 [Lentzea guizhouensis]|uniref:Uncharacterized protein n=1 Tax=Lentzea guizhouensis TaxID=1586287 RepID=A0A1B2HSB6_9PSEU|nr:hypothetical protein BBK82_35975 [Lentzea guizhouensis]